MSRLASLLIRLAARSAARRFEAVTRDPAAAQQQLLRQILERNRDTEYGREYGFGAIRNLDDWRRAVPPVDYEAIRGRVERVTRGEPNVLTAESPVMFARSSGTTGEPKFIPVTPTCRGRDHAGTMRVWLHHAVGRHPSIFRRQVISLVSPAVEGHTPSGLPYGSTSGQIYRDMPRWVRGTYAAPYELFLVDDYEAKYYALMRVALDSDVTFLATANPSSILQMCRFADEHADDLVRDVADGTLSTALPIEQGPRAAVEARLRRNPGRARELERARKTRGGRLLPADYWPHLALIGCWKGGTVGRYVQRFPDWFDPDRRGMVPVRDWGYLSSEARGSVPVTDHGSAGVLTVAANVFEFVRAEELESSPGDPARWRFSGVAEALEEGLNDVFQKTTGGLYRYDINDVVEIVGRYNRTPTIRFKRKGRGVANITGEKLSVNQLLSAVEACSVSLGTTLDHFRAEADLARSRYVFKVEAPELPARRRPELLERLDGELCRLNIEYRAKRASLRLGAPLLMIMRNGWYERQRRRVAAEGRRLFQAKTVLLDAEASFEEEPDEVEETLELRGDGPRAVR